MGFSIENAKVILLSIIENVKDPLGFIQRHENIFVILGVIIIMVAFYLFSKYYSEGHYNPN